ncbi:MAG TPA: NAD(P)-dependent oxidoreductase [Hyphomicrobiaceae bacterium]|nr:NAD(P)-dependent oxidoreductase [Hyphomicrobiaceae bacterium]
MRASLERRKSAPCVLVTGASGFAGSVIARRLAEGGRRVVALYRRETAFLARLAGVAGVYTLRADLADGLDLPGPFEAVVHAAATSPAPAVDAVRIARDNVTATASLIGAAERWGTRAFVLLSSLSVYGEIRTKVVDEATPIVNPDAYGMSKYLCELMLAARSERLPAIALRLPGVLGPGAHRNWMSRTAAALQAGLTVGAFHLDRPYNNAVHVDDLAAFVASILDRRWTGFDAVVLGAGDAIPLRTAIERLAAGLGVHAVLEEVSAPLPSFTLSSERAISRWGYRPSAIAPLLDRYARDLKASGA